jgi:hypothetical protein
MGWNTERAVPNWEGTLSALKECLESVQMGLDLGEQERIRPDVLCLDALDELDTFLSHLKRDLGL